LQNHVSQEVEMIAINPSPSEVRREAVVSGLYREPVVSSGLYREPVGSSGLYREPVGSSGLYREPVVNSLPTVRNEIILDNILF
jgi:hypothetical protein